MKNLIIDFTKPYSIKGFTDSGFGNIVYIIAFCLFNIRNQNTPIFVNLDKSISFKTYRDTIFAIDNLNFGNFKISNLEYPLQENTFIIDKLLYLNDESENNYVVDKNINDITAFFHSFRMKPDFDLGITFKYDNILKQYLSTKFNDIENSIIINVRRGEKLQECYKNYLIVHQNTYHEIIKKNLNKQIIFISDDIKWCKDNFQKYQNVKFYEDTIKDKMICDQYLMANCEHLIFNLDCTFSHIPFLIKNNKIKKATLVMKDSDFEFEKSMPQSRSNTLKNELNKEVEIIIGKSAR